MSVCGAEDACTALGNVIFRKVGVFKIHPLTSLSTTTTMLFNDVLDVDVASVVVDVDDDAEVVLLEHQLQIMLLLILLFHVQLSMLLNVLQFLSFLMLKSVMTSLGS